jgi:hypothetical protein
MRYKDKGFLKYQEKQRDREVGYWSHKSDRQLRREKEQRFETFYQNFLVNKFKIDKFWWKNLKDSDKEKIISLYNLQYDLENQNFDWSTDPVFETWDEWFEYIKSTFNTNKIQLREDKLKSIGI